MKAKEFIELLKSTDKKEEIYELFIKDTTKLLAERSQFSQEETIGPVIEGVLKNQKQKWEAVSRQTEVLTFEAIMMAYGQEIDKQYLEWKKKFKPNKQIQQEEINMGRNLAKG